METTQQNSLRTQHEQVKENKTQLQTIFHYLQRHTATASMVTEATGIPQKCICRYKRDLEKSGLLAEIKKGPCKITNHLAWFLTTNKALFPKSNQTKLF